MAGIRCSACPLRVKDIFVPFTDDEIAFMQSFKKGELEVEAGTTVLMEGSSSPQLYTVLSGMGTRYKTLENGRRQVINFLFPGDFSGLQASLMGEMKHSVEASTHMRLCVFKREDIWTLFRAHPERAYDLTWISAVEEYFLGETLASIGQRDAAQRIAWAFVRMFERLRAVDMTQQNTVPLPFRQRDLADALGLSLVHTNKTLQKLRCLDLAHWMDGKLTIHNLPALADLAMIDLEKPARRPIM